MLGSCCLVLALLGSGAASQERAPGVRRTVYVVEVDPERARAIGWASQDASDAQVVANAEQVVRRRLTAMERSFQLRTEPEQHRLELSMPQIQPRDRELFNEMLRSIGLCEFFFFADEGQTLALGIDLEAEAKKLDSWRRANPGRPIETFTIGPEQPGPHTRFFWVDSLFAGEQQSSPYCLTLPEEPEDSIGAASFESSRPALDMFGYPAIAFDVRDGRKEDFERVTESHVKQRMAIVVGGKLVSAPQLESKLVGGGLVGGRFSQEQTEAWMEALRKCEGPLRVVEIR